MNSLILSHNFYSDIDSLSNLISTMEFEDNLFGQEIKDFNFIPQGIEKQFEFNTKEQLEVQPDTGIFRKPNPMVHFESFYQHCQWLCIIALEDTVFKIHEQENIKTVYDVENLEEFLLNNNSMDNWSTTTQINMKRNGYVFVRPWLWHSLEKDKLVQMFLLNREIKEE